MTWKQRGGYLWKFLFCFLSNVGSQSSAEKEDGGGGLFWYVGQTTVFGKSYLIRGCLAEWGGTLLGVFSVHRQSVAEDKKWKNPLESLSHLVIYSLLVLGLNFFLSHQKIKKIHLQPPWFAQCSTWFLLRSCGQIFILFFYNLVAVKMFESRALKFPIHHFVSCFFYFFFAFLKQAREQPHLSQPLWRRLQGLRGSFRLELGHSWACSSRASNENHYFLPRPQYQLHRQLGCRNV